jgi:GMP synthase-like glutamine amidotransferase
MKRIGIFETGRPSLDLINKFGDSPQLFRTYFAEQKNLLFTTYSVCRGDAIPRPQDCDAFLLTGSEHSVYDKLVWIPPVMEFIRNAVGESIPVLGICFGHQLMAQAFGGEVRKSPKGRGIGIHQHMLTDIGQRVFSGLDAIGLMAAHQDQVIIPPPEGKLLASSPFCDYAGFSYGKSGLSLQGHPEIIPDFEKQIITDWQKSDPVDPQIVTTALRSLDEVRLDAAAIRNVLARFLSGHLALG